MNHLIKRLEPWQWLVLLGLVLFSTAMWYAFYAGQLTLAYNDAKSYLNIARLVFESQQPGLAQIGSVWLPFAHIIKMPFIWIEGFWRSGLAGSLVSMASYVCTVIGAYAVTVQLTRQRIAGLVAGAAVAFNANLLYLQSTPLTEPLYIALLVWSVYFLVRYLQTSQLQHMLPLALLVSLQIVTRYDGWFIAVAIALIVFWHELRARRVFSQAFGQTLLFAAPVAFAGLLWVGWNALIFSDPLYFMHGPESARMQQEVIADHSGLITQGSAITSFAAYGYAAAGNVGWLLLGTGLAGWAAFLIARRRLWRLPVVVLAVLGAVFAFNVLALMLGFSALNVPQLGWQASDTVEPFFNVRYGILMLPLAAVGAGLAAATWRHAWLLVLGLILWQGAIAFIETPVTVRDGTSGASAFVQHDLASQLENSVREGENVLLSMTRFNPVAFESGVPLRQIVHEGVHSRWEQTLAHPEPWVEWIVMGTDTTDPVYERLHGDTGLNAAYERVYHDEHGSIYRRAAAATVGR